MSFLLKSANFTRLSQTTAFSVQMSEKAYFIKLTLYTVCQTLKEYLHIKKKIK